MADDTKSVLVTVGTTSFDRLIKEASSPEIVVVLRKLGYTRLILQYGRGEFEPEEIKSDNFEIEAFRYKDSIHDDISSASLVISHAGAGTVLETLGSGRPLVVIINEQLMGNHQLELAHQLAADGHLFYGTCRYCRSAPPTGAVSLRGRSDKQGQDWTSAHRVTQQSHLECERELSGILRDMDISTLKPYIQGEPKKFACFLDRLMGLS